MRKFTIAFFVSTGIGMILFMALPPPVIAHHHHDTSVANHDHHVIDTAPNVTITPAEDLIISPENSVAIGHVINIDQITSRWTAACKFTKENNIVCIVQNGRVSNAEIVLSSAIKFASKANLPAPTALWRVGKPDIAISLRPKGGGKTSLTPDYEWSDI